MKSFIFALLFLLAVPAGTAWAQDNFDQSVERGKTAFESGKYTDAVDAFLAAYKARPTASLLYNIGRSYDAAGDLENAEVYYERFVNAPGITQESRADAVSRLKTVRDIKQMKEADKKRTESTEASKAAAATTPTKPAATTKPAETTVSGAKKAPAVSPLTWGLVGVGAASLVGGVITGVMSQGKFDDIEAMGYPNAVSAGDLEEVQSARDSGNTLKVTSVVLMGGGVLLVAGGVATYFLMQPESDKSEAAWNIQPVLAPTSAGLQFSGKW